MGAVHIGLNAEYSRSSDKPFEWAVEEAAKMGYVWFEPMVHFGRELMSEAGYFHTVSMFEHCLLGKSGPQASFLVKPSEESYECGEDPEGVEPAH